MLPDTIEQLKREYTGASVVVDAPRPEWARFQGMTGRVITVNWSGCALVQFDGHAGAGWYDIPVADLRVVENPEPPRSADLPG